MNTYYPGSKCLDMLHRFRIVNFVAMADKLLCERNPGGYR